MSAQPYARRRRARHRSASHFLLGLLLVAIAVGYFASRTALSDAPTTRTPAETESVDVDTDYTGDSELNAELVSKAESDSAVRDILRSYQNYPTSLLALFARNSETLDFVQDYPDHHTDAAAKKLDKNEVSKIPLLFQWDERWGYTTYGDDMLAITGCGPTCLSMVAAGLTGDRSLTPAAVATWADGAGYYVSGSGSSWTLMSEGSAHFGLTAKELSLDEGVMSSALKDGSPIICAMGPGDFTTSGHFIVLSAYKKGHFTIHDPNSKSHSKKSWSYDDLSDQIKCLWSFTLA